jgi:hypothetical protein
MALWLWRSPPALRFWLLQTRWVIQFLPLFLPAMWFEVASDVLFLLFSWRRHRKTLKYNYYNFQNMIIRLKTSGSELFECSGAHLSWRAIRGRLGGKMVTGSISLWWEISDFMSRGKSSATPLFSHGPAQNSMWMCACRRRCCRALLSCRRHILIPGSRCSPFLGCSAQGHFYQTVTVYSAPFLWWRATRALGTRGLLNLVELFGSSRCTALPPSIPSSR